MTEQYPPFYELTSDNRAGVVAVASIIVLIYAIIALGIKFFIRLNITSVQDFDIVLFVGIIVYVAQTACVLVACNNGLGQHQDAISEEQFDGASKALYASHILAILAFGCAKLSVCLLIRQLSNHGWLRRTNHFLSALVVVWAFSGALAATFQCPFPRPWSPRDCPANERVYIFNGAMNILTDIALSLLPMVMMMEVQTGMQRKIVVTILFGCRLVTPAAMIPSIIHYQPQDDSTWSYVSSTVWLQISLGSSLITACIPSLKSVIDSYLGGTAWAAVQGPYELTPIGNGSGHGGLRALGNSVTMSATRENKNKSKRQSKIGMEDVGESSRGDKKKGGEENESVEGLTTAREESDREVASRTASNPHSRGSSVVDYNI